MIKFGERTSASPDRSWRIRTFLLRLTGLAKDDARKHEAGTDKVQ